MANNNIHWSYYTAGFITAFIIGIDCAINAAFYMALMGGFYAIPIVLVFCALAGLVLNTILYANDFPEAISDFVDNIKAFFAGIYNYNETIATVINNSAAENYELAKNGFIFMSKEVIALASGIVMGLFTYSAYLGMALPFTSPILIAVFCGAYVFGIYALIRTSLNTKYTDDTTITDKINDLSLTGKLVTSIITAIFIAATYWTMLTFLAGAISAAAAFAPILVPVIPALFVLLLIGESIFAVKAAVWLGAKISSPTPETNSHPKKFIMIVMALLNAFANAAITAAGSTKIAAVYGFIFSFGVMYKSSNEQDIESSEQQKATINKAFKVAVNCILAAALIWANFNFLTPALVVAGAANPVLSGIMIIVLIMLVVSTINNPFNEDSVVGQHSIKNQINEGEKYPLLHAQEIAAEKAKQVSPIIEADTSTNPVIKSVATLFVTSVITNGVSNALNGIENSSGAKATKSK